MVTLRVEIKPFDVPSSVTILLPRAQVPAGTAMPRTYAGVLLPSNQELPLSALTQEELAALCDEFTTAVFAAAGHALE